MEPNVVGTTATRKGETREAAVALRLCTVVKRMNHLVQDKRDLGAGETKKGGSVKQDLDCVPKAVQVSFLDLNIWLMNNQIDAVRGMADQGSVESLVEVLRVVCVSLSPLVTLLCIVRVMGRLEIITIGKDVVFLSVRGVLWSNREIEQ